MRNSQRTRRASKHHLVAVVGSVLLTACAVPSDRRADWPRDPGGSMYERLAQPTFGDATAESAENASQLVAPEDEAKREGGPRNPGERYEQWYRDRAGDDGVFSFQEVFDAKAHMDQMPVIDALQGDGGIADAGIWNWEWLGPGNVGGRIRAIVIHPTTPTTMWVGSVSGGIWRTTNGGASWSPVNDFLPTLAVSTMVMDPDVSNTMYAGTGEGFWNIDALPGAGVFKSTDGGVTWAQLAATANWNEVNRLAIDPSNGQHLLAATNGGLYQSTNGGAAWTFRRGGRWLDVKFNPWNGLAVDTNAIAGGDNGTAIYSTDNGVTWQNATFAGAPGSTTVRVASVVDGDANDDTLEVVDATDFCSGDPITVGSGGSAETVTVAGRVDNNTLTVGDLRFAHAVGAAVTSLVGGRVEVAYSAIPVDSVVAAMNVGCGTIWHSSDGGQSYSRVSNTDDDYMGGQGWYNNALWVSLGDADDLVVGGINVYRSRDGGATLTPISDWSQYHVGTSAHADNHTIVPHPTSTTTLFVGNDGGIQRVAPWQAATPTSGWTNLAHNLGITQFYGGAASPDQLYIIGGTQDNDTLRYRPMDGAQAWYQAETGDGGYCAIDYANPGAPNFYAEYTNLAIEKSTDFGQTYFGATTGLADAGSGRTARFIAPFSIATALPSRLVAGGTSIWRTTDRAANWSSIRGPLNGCNPATSNCPKCSAIDISAASSNHIWVGYDNGRVSRTSDAGANWVDVDDNGTTPLPNSVITDIAINPQNENQVFITVGGYRADSVWYTDDNGATWQRRTGAAPFDLPAIQVNTVRFHPVEDNWVYIGTDLGVLASEDRGLTWGRTMRYADNEGPVNTEVAELFWQGDYLVAATHGRGMYRTRPLDIVYVDWAGDIDFGDGSFGNPCATLGCGQYNAGNGSTISIRAGTYFDAPITISKRVKIVSRGGAAIVR